MDYEDILPVLTVLSFAPGHEPGWFDSQSVSHIFKTTYSFNLPVRPNRIYPPQAFEVKSISASLNRLYRMGLLRRERVKREITRKRDGKQFVRGYKYLYLVSNQGRKYAAYLTARRADTVQQRHSDKYRQPWDIDDGIIRKYALKFATSEEAAKELLAEDPKKYQLPEHGVYRRFPRRYDKELFLKYVASRIYLEKVMLVNIIMQQKRDRKLKKFQEDLDNYNIRESRITGRDLLLEAQIYFQDNKINPMIQPDVELSPNAPIGTVPLEGVPLLDLLRCITRKLSEMGIR